jgi:hypothetical protein
MIYIHFIILSSYAAYYSANEISLLCISGNADSNPPSLSPGNDTISKINKIKPEIYLEKYYNTTDFDFTHDEQLKYAIDLLPYSFFFYMMIISIIVWFVYISCAICKCCYCLSGPVTKVQSRQRLLCPPILMGIFMLGILGCSPFCIYYISLLESAIKYLICVTARWSGGYYYGYSNWNGITATDNSTSILSSTMSSTSNSLNQTLYKYNDYGVRTIKNQIQSEFNTFVDQWKDLHDQSNPNYGNYSNDIPQYYNCTLCKALPGYAPFLNKDLDVLISPLSQNITIDITDIYKTIIDNIDNILSTFQSNYQWTKHLTELYDKYEEINLPNFDKFNQMQLGLYGYSLTLFGLTILMMFSQALAGGMVYYQRYKWRKVLHIGWCCHSFLMIFCNI